MDAAYGGTLAFSEKHRDKLSGIELADSITFDPHKWMFVPFACGAVLVRDGGRVLRDAFDITPEYLNEDRGGADVEFDFFRYGQMGTRRFNSLKLWMALKFMGREGYAAVIEHQIELTEYLAGRIDELADFETRWLRLRRPFVVSGFCRRICANRRRRRTGSLATATATGDRTQR